MAEVRSRKANLTTKTNNPKQTSDVGRKWGVFRLLSIADEKKAIRSIQEILKEFLRLAHDLCILH
jgi:hypothetical protein